MSVGAEYGGRGAKGAERVLADVNTLFAGGEMADEDLVTEIRQHKNAKIQIIG